VLTALITLLAKVKTMARPDPLIFSQVSVGR
jgi:hypothetical protein